MNRSSGLRDGTGHSKQRSQHKVTARGGCDSLGQRPSRAKNPRPARSQSSTPLRRPTACWFSLDRMLATPVLHEEAEAMGPSTQGHLVEERGS